MHALCTSDPLCGFSKKFAKDWPKNHDWVSFRDIDEITCTVCKEKAKALIEKESNGENTTTKEEHLIHQKKKPGKINQNLKT